MIFRFIKFPEYMRYPLNILFKKMANRKKQHTTLLWLLLFVTGTILLFYNIGHESIWYDESYSALVASHPFGEIIRLIAADQHPPFYFLGLRIFYLLFGRSPIALRSFSVLGVLLMATLGVSFVRRIGGEKAGLTFSLLVFITPIFFSMAQEMRMYTWACFFVTLTALSGYLFITDSRKVDGIIFGAATILAAYTHYYALISVGFIQGSIIGWAFIKKRERIVACLAIAGISLLLILPWLIILYQRLIQVAADYWIEAINWGVIKNCLLFPFSTKKAFSSAYPFPSFLIPLGAGIFWLLIILSMIKSATVKRQVVLLNLLAMAGYGLMLLAAILLSIIVRPILVARYTFVGLGLLLIIISYGISHFYRRQLYIGAIVLYFICTLPVLNFIANYRSNGPMYEAKEYVGKVLQEDDVFIHSYEHTMGTFIYYFPDNKHFLYLRPGFKGYSNYEAFKPGGAYGSELTQFIKGKKNVWLVDQIGSNEFVPMVKLKKAGNYHKTGSSKLFTLEFSYAMIQLTKYELVNEVPSSERDEKKYGTIQVHISGFHNDKGQAFIGVYNRYLYDYRLSLLNVPVKDNLVAGFPKRIDADIFEELFQSNGISFYKDNKAILHNIYHKDGDSYIIKNLLLSGNEKHLKELSERQYEQKYSRFYPIHNNSLTLTLAHLPYDDYVIEVYHDENNNRRRDFYNGQKIDEGFGITKTGHIANFDTASIRLDQEVKEVHIVIAYDRK